MTRLLIGAVVTIALWLAFVFFCTGCVQTKFAAPNGASFSTTRFLWNGQIGEASIETNGTARIRGYTSDAAEVARGVAEGLSAGLVKGANPAK